MKPRTEERIAVIIEALVHNRIKSTDSILQEVQKLVNRLLDLSTTLPNILYYNDDIKILIDKVDHNIFCTLIMKGQTYIFGDIITLLRVYLKGLVGDNFIVPENAKSAPICFD